MRVNFARCALLSSLLLAAAWSPASADEVDGCPSRVVDVSQVKVAAGVQSVVVDASATRATVIFTNGDVLRLGTTGCVTPMLAARLWVAGDDALSDAAWLERARSVAALVLAPAQSAQVGASLASNATVTHVDGGLKIDHALGNGSGFSLAVVRAPHDSLGSSLSMVFRNL